MFILFDFERSSDWISYCYWYGEVRGVEESMVSMNIRFKEPEINQILVNISVSVFFNNKTSFWLCSLDIFFDISYLRGVLKIFAIE